MQTITYKLISAVKKFNSLVPNFWHGGGKPPGETTSSEQVSIIESIRPTIDTLDPDHSYSVVLGGDFNFIQDTVLDSDGGKPSLKTSSIAASVQLQNARDLVDIWRSRNPHVKRFIDKKPFPSKTTRLFSNFQLLARPCYGKSAIAVAGEFEHMFTNTEVHKIVHISKTNQDYPNL